jgi:hypothetical protein
MNAASAAFRVNARGMADATASVGLLRGACREHGGENGGGGQNCDGQARAAHAERGFPALELRLHGISSCNRSNAQILKRKGKARFGGSARQPTLISRIRDRFLGLRSPVKTGIAGPGGQNRIAPDLHREAGNPTLRAIREAMRARGGGDPPAGLAALTRVPAKADPCGAF